MVSKNKALLIDQPRPEEGDEHGDRETALEDMASDLAGLSVFHDDQNQEDLTDADPDNLSVFDPDAQLDEVESEEVGKVEVDPTKRRVVQRIRRDLSDMMTSQAARIRRASGHQTAYKKDDGTPEIHIDFVDENRDSEKLTTMAKLAVLNEEFSQAGGKWGDEPPPLQIRIKSIPSDLKNVAQLVGGDPALMWWPRFMRDRPGKIVAKLARMIRKKIDSHPNRYAMNSFQAAHEASALWNFEVQRRKPSSFALITRGGKLVVDKDGKPVRKLVGYSHLGPAWKPSDPKLAPNGKLPVVVIAEPETNKKRKPNTVKVDHAKAPWPYPGTVYRAGSEMTFNPKTPCSFDTTKEPYSITPALVDDFMERAEAGEPLLIFERHQDEKERVLDSLGQPKKGAMRMEPKILRDESGKPKLFQKPTKCAVSDASLVMRKTTGWRSWEIAPTLWGMNVRTARAVVDAAAIAAGFLPGAVENAPEIVGKLATPALKDLGKAFFQIVEASGRKDEMDDVYDDTGERMVRRGKRLGRLMLEILEKSDANNASLAAKHDEFGNETEAAATQEEVEAAQTSEWFVDEGNLAALGTIVAEAEAWAIIAVATGNTTWGLLCQKLLEYRDRYHFKMSEPDIKKNQSDLKKLAQRLRMYLTAN